MKNYLDMLERHSKLHGEKFDPSNLAAQFKPYYESEQRIEVSLAHETKIVRGRVGVTTGWKPCFILLLRSNSTSSSITLSADDKILSIIR